MTETGSLRAGWLSKSGVLGITWTQFLLDWLVANMEKTILRTICPFSRK